MKYYLFFASIIAFSLLPGCHGCDEDHCYDTSAEPIVRIKFNMDSLHGGFTKAQLGNVNIVSNSQSLNTSQVKDSVLIIKAGGSKNGGIFPQYVTITNTATSTQNSLTNIKYDIKNPDCCDYFKEHRPTTFLYNGKQYLAPAPHSGMVIDFTISNN